MNHRGTEAQKDDLTGSVIGCAIEGHRHLGPGLLESAYEACLGWGLKHTGLQFARQQSLPIQYKGVSLDVGYRVDRIVEKQVVLELTTVDEIQPIHEALLLTYLKLTGIGTGLVINFKTAVLRNGIKRMVL